MRDRLGVGCGLVQTHLRDQLVDDDDDAYGADEAAEEGPAEDGVEEAQAAEARGEDDGARQPRHHAGDLGALLALVVLVVAVVDGRADDGAGQERAGGFGPDDHLRAGAEEGIDQGVEDERVQAVDGRDVAEVGRVGERHGDVERGHCEGGDEVATEVLPSVLLYPVDSGQIV